MQEALTNTLKHSGAAKVTVRLTYRPSSLLLDVLDDGTRTSTENGHGHGIVGIGERVSLFGGTATAEPVHNGGWRVHAELPLSPVQGQPAAVPPTS